MPSPRKCRYGKDCHYGPTLCRYSHSYLEEEAEEIRLQLEAQFGSDPFSQEEDIPLTDDEGYGSDVMPDTSSVFLSGDDAAEANVATAAISKPSDNADSLECEKREIPSLKEKVLRWYESYYSAPVRAKDIVDEAQALSRAPADVQDALWQRLSYMSLRALQRTKWLGSVVTEQIVFDSTKTAAFQFEARALLNAVDKQGVGQYAGSDDGWIMFRTEAICAPKTVQKFRGLYQRRLSIMQQTLNFSSKRDYFHSLEDFLEELRREAGLCAWPSWQLSGARPGPGESTVQAQDRILRVWMENLRAALTDV